MSPDGAVPRARHAHRPGPDGRLRCRWCAASPECLANHDYEWGFPVADDWRLFEKLCLEGFQSGLSWRTRAAFHGFDIDRVARFGARDIARLLQDAAIVRHRGKIEAAIHNARCAQALIAQEGSLAAYVWRHDAPAASAVAGCVHLAGLGGDVEGPEEARRKFVGPTTVYAFMQAMGLVNDHAGDCVLRAEVERARAAFKPPRR